MKILKYMAWAVVGMLALQACSQADEPVAGAEEGTEVFGKIAQLVPSTRALDGNLQFSWTQDDRICVWSEEGGQMFAFVNTTENAGVAKFTGGGFSLKKGKTYYSIYPFDQLCRATEIPVSFLNQVQQGNGSADHLLGVDYIFATATCDELTGVTTFTYNHLPTLVKFVLDLPAGETVNSVSLNIQEGIASFLTAGTYNLLTGVLTPTKTEQELTLDLQQATVTDGKLVAFLAMGPVNLEDCTLEVVATTATSEYRGLTQGGNFQSGHFYSGNFTLALEEDVDGSTLENFTFEDGQW